MLLIIDDLKEMVEVIEEMIRDHWPISQIKSFTDPRDAMLYARDADVQVALVDLAMPHVHGLQFVQELRLHNDCPILVISGYAEVYMHELVGIKNVYVLEKPFMQDALCDLLKKLFPQVPAPRITGE